LQLLINPSTSEGLGIVVRPYDLPDIRLIKNDADKLTDHHLIFRPDHLCIVLGNGNDLERSIHKEPVSQDNIPVYRRPSGGQAVLLSPGTLVVSYVMERNHFKSAMLYFDYFNQKIMVALKSIGVENTSIKGISDICIGQYKIAGSAIYQNKSLVFYQSVLNVSESGSLIEKYIKHPVREPDYRKGRRHVGFVSSLNEQGYLISFVELKEALEEGFTRDTIDRK
jgi:lipoate-protein ligase A